MISYTNLSLMDAVDRLKKNDGKLKHEDAQTLKKELEGHLKAGLAKNHEIGTELGSFLKQTPKDAFEAPSDRDDLRKFASEQYGAYEKNRGFINRFLDYNVRDRDGDGIKDGKKRPFDL